MASRKHRWSNFNLFRSYEHYTPGWGGLFVFLLFFLLGFLLANLAGVGIVLCSSAGLLAPDFFESYGQLIAYPLMFIPPMMFAAAKSRLNIGFDESVPLDSNNFIGINKLGAAAGVSLMTLALSLALDPITALLPPMSETMRKAMQLLTEGPLIVNILCVCIFAPFFEEWLCRGMLLRILLKKCHPAIAIILSSVFFGLIHGNLWQAIPAFLMGCIFGWIYYRTGSLKLTMLMHFLNNAFALTISRIPALKDYDCIKDMLGGEWSAAYLVTVLACWLVVGFCLYRFSRVRKVSAAESESGLPTSSSSKDAGI